MHGTEGFGKSPLMKATEILAVVLLAPLGIFGGLPGIAVFAVGITVVVVAVVAKERERDEVAARQAAQALRDSASAKAPRAR